MIKLGKTQSASTAAATTDDGFYPKFFFAKDSGGAEVILYLDGTSTAISALVGANDGFVEGTSNYFLGPTSNLMGQADGFYSVAYEPPDAASIVLRYKVGNPAA